MNLAQSVFRKFSDHALDPSVRIFHLEETWHRTECHFFCHRCHSIFQLLQDRGKQNGCFKGICDFVRVCFSGFWGDGTRAFSPQAVRSDEVMAEKRGFRGSFGFEGGIPRGMDSMVLILLTFFT